MRKVFRIFLLRNIKEIWNFAISLNHSNNEAIHFHVNLINHYKSDKNLRLIVSKVHDCIKGKVNLIGMRAIYATFCCSSQTFLELVQT